MNNDKDKKENVKSPKKKRHYKRHNKNPNLPMSIGNLNQLRTTMQMLMKLEKEHKQEIEKLRRVIRELNRAFDF